MRIISLKPLRKFWQAHARTEQSLKAWHAEVKAADWDSSADVKKKFGKASVINNERVVFDICGNNFRLIVAINYAFKVVYVKWLGTHAEYDKIDPETVEYDPEAD